MGTTSPKTGLDSWDNIFGFKRMPLQEGAACGPWRREWCHWTMVYVNVFRLRYK